MGVVELDRGLARQQPQVGIFRREPPQDVAQARRGEEVFLLQPQRLALGRGVVGIEHPADRAGQRLGLGGGGVLALVEPVEVEDPQGFRAPEPQRVGPAPAPADHRRVMRLGADRLGRGPDHAGALGADLAAKADLERRLGPRELPGIVLPQPVFRVLDLTAAAKALPEQPVLVADAIAHRRAAQRRQALHEAGREPPEAAIAQRRVGLVLKRRGEVDAQLGHRLLDLVAHPDIDDRVLEQPADQEFHRQVVDPLLLPLVGRPRRREPGIDESVPDRPAERHPPVEQRRMRRVLPEGQLQVVEDVYLKSGNGHSGLRATPACSFWSMSPAYPTRKRFRYRFPCSAPFRSCPGHDHDRRTPLPAGQKHQAWRQGQPGSGICQLMLKIVSTWGCTALRHNRSG